MGGMGGGMGGPGGMEGLGDMEGLGGEDDVSRYLTAPVQPHLPNRFL